MSNSNPYSNGHGLVGGLGQMRATRGKSKPISHRWVLNPFEVDGDLEAGREFFVDAPIEVEIGFARGHFLRDRIRQAPERKFLAFEVRRQWCERMARFLDRESFDNTRVILADARPLLTDLLQPNSTSAFYVFFPDPWWKKKHHKRRVMSPDSLKLIHHLLEPGGSLHFRTDVAAYAELVEEIVDQHGGFQPAVPGQTTTGDLLPLTHREKKCQEVGIDVHSMHFVKVDLT